MLSSTFSAAAEAAGLTFVAANGNDANPCTVITAPCKTLQRAYTVTPINGTINVLTSLESTLTINKNIIVAGNGVEIVGSIVIGTSSTNAVVTLRGLALNGAKIYNNGIRIDAAAVVHIEECTVERYNTDGIKLVASTATKLFVSDTVSRDNGGVGLFANDSNALVEVDNSRFQRNVLGLGLHGRQGERHPQRRIRKRLWHRPDRRNGKRYGHNGVGQHSPGLLFLFRRRRDPGLLRGPRQCIRRGPELRFGVNYRIR